MNEQRRHSLNQINEHLAKMNGKINGILNGQLNRLNAHLFNNNQLNNQLNNQVNNQISNHQPVNQQNSQTKRRHHHHKHPENKKSNTKPYVLTNINQRYKLSENLKIISERRKSLTNSTKITELKSKLGDISENQDFKSNEIAHHQSTTADILCLRPKFKITNF